MREIDNILEKLAILERIVAKEKGPFDLFALFSSDEEDSKWDLVISATWIGQENRVSLEYLNEKLRTVLNTQELSSIAKVALLDVYDPRVKDIQRIITTEHKVKELTDYRFYGFRIDKIYIITCKLQIDRRLMRKMWNIIVKMWVGGNRIIESDRIRHTLNTRGEKPPDYAMDRVFEYLIESKCIKGVQYMNSQGTKEHGAIKITWINPDCKPPLSLQTQSGTSTLKVKSKG